MRLRVVSGLGPNIQEYAMSTLLDFFEHNPTGRQIDKWMPYLEVYERHFARYRGRPVSVLEIGVFGGGSLQMWKHYFGPHANIYGVDINPACKKFEDQQIEILIGDQGDREFLKRLCRQIPMIDILIDDGSHIPAHQIATFEELFPHVAEDGVFLCEDLHSNYWRRFGAGPRHPGTFVEYAKKLVDQLSAWHSEDHSVFEIDDFTLSAHSMHFYDSMLVIEKRPMTAPVRRRSLAR
jgi:23S rRNA U2552 (ribose-2'-O)-methylase RlmE/FtsJ